MASIRNWWRKSSAFQTPSLICPSNEKREVLRPAPDVTRGYIPLEAESVGRSQGVDAPGDLNESLMIGPVDVTDDSYFTAPEAGRHFHPNLWPREPKDLRPAYEDYFRVMGKLAEELDGDLRARARPPGVVLRR